MPVFKPAGAGRLRCRIDDDAVDVAIPRRDRLLQVRAAREQRVAVGVKDRARLRRAPRPLGAAGTSGLPRPDRLAVRLAGGGLRDAGEQRAEVLLGETLRRRGRARTRAMLRRGALGPARLDRNGTRRPRRPDRCSATSATRGRGTRRPHAGVTSRSGAEAPDVMPTVSTPSIQAGSMSPTSSIRYATTPAVCATSTSRFELDGFAEADDSSSSTSCSSSLTAHCRFDVT